MNATAASLPASTPVTASSSSVITCTIDEHDAGQRIDNYLRRVLKGVPFSHLYRLLRTGQVRVNKKRAKAADRLAAGDVVRLPPVRVANATLTHLLATTGNTNRAGNSAKSGNAGEGLQNHVSLPEAVQESINAARKNRVQLPVIYEDEALLVIDKPAGVAVHGGSGVSFGVIEALRAQRPEARFLELAHRLDRETSGVLLIAKKRSALRALHESFRQHGQTIDKRYLVWVKGAWFNAHQQVRLPLCKYLDAAGERRVRVDQQEGKPAHTVFHLLARWGEVSLLEAHLHSGRTHQIRVHLAHLGFPVLGDEKYGDFAVNRALNLPRMALHAYRLQLPHPLTHVALEFSAPPPAALQKFTVALGMPLSGQVPWANPESSAKHG